MTLREIMDAEQSHEGGSVSDVKQRAREFRQKNACGTERFWNDDTAAAFHEAAIREHYRQNYGISGRPVSDFHYRTYAFEVDGVAK